jgi:hypothetical protein
MRIGRKLQQKLGKLRVTGGGPLLPKAVQEVSPP